MPDIPTPLEFIKRAVEMQTKIGGEGAAMTKHEKREGLLVIWADLDEEYRRTFRMWHNCEHVAERVTLPGFCAGYRYEGLAGAPHYIMFYETVDSKVLASKPYLRSVNHPTPGTKESIAHFKNPVRTIYSLLAASGKEPPVVAPYIYVERFNLRDLTEQEAIHWYRDHYLPGVSALPGVFRGRLYGGDPSISGIMSTERKIYAPGMGAQRYLCLFEIGSPDIPASPAWKDCLTAIEKDKQKERQMEDAVQELYWLDFAMNAPGYD